jgi:ABC-2 type transport system permease protein
MSLVKAERRRFFKRRLTRLMILFLLLAMGTIVTVTALNTTKIGPAEVAAAQARAQEETEREQAFAARERADCEAAKESGSTDDRFPPDMDCSQIRGPQPGDIEAKWFLPHQFTFKDEFEPLILAFAGMLALFGFVVGASYVGAEWSSGGMMNLLLWRPRRMPVLLIKLSTALAGVLGVGLVLGAGWTAGLWLISKYDGDVSGMTQGTWESFALTGARGFGLALALTAIGVCLASFGRHTAMALGVAIGATMLVEVGARIALDMTDVALADRYMLSTYGLAWVLKSWKLEDYNVCDWSLGQCEPRTLLITWQDSAPVFGAMVVVALVLAFWSIRRRDVT